MHQGNWTCSGCNGIITELPFEPKGTKGLLCRDCHSKKKGTSTTAPKKQEGDIPWFSGNWKCSDCGAPITSLPFEPKNTTSLKCVDCFVKSKRN